MTIYRVRQTLLLALLALVFCPHSAHADKIGRDASFLPPADPSAVPDAAPPGQPGALGPPPSASGLTVAPLPASVTAAPLPPVDAASTAPTVITSSPSTTLSTAVAPANGNALLGVGAGSAAAADPSLNVPTVITPTVQAPAALTPAGINPPGLTQLPPVAPVAPLTTTVITSAPGAPRASAPAASVGVTAPGGLANSAGSIAGGPTLVSPAMLNGDASAPAVVAPTGVAPSPPPAVSTTAAGMVSSGSPAVIRAPTLIYSAHPTISYSAGSTSLTPSTSIGGDPTKSSDGNATAALPVTSAPTSLSPTTPLSPGSGISSGVSIPPGMPVQPAVITAPAAAAPGMITMPTPAPEATSPLSNPSIGIGGVAPRATSNINQVAPAVPTPGVSTTSGAVVAPGASPTTSVAPGALFPAPTIITSTPPVSNMVVHDSSNTVFLPPAPATVTTPQAPVPATGATATTAIIQPVQANTLGDINPESIGLLGTAEGGLGADMWKGTPRALVQRLLPSVTVPTVSPTLNNLAARFLLSTASAPSSATAEGEPSLAAIRIEKLVALGQAADAWKLVQLTKPDQVDDLTLRLAAEAALVSRAGADVCARLPDIIKVHTGPEWQKLMLICQLRAKDMVAAQLSLDLLHNQAVKDDTFFALAEKNVMGTSKQLPRQLTPVKPLTVALLRMVDLPLRDEVYAHPDADVMNELLKVKAINEKPRLDLAERAASHGLIDATALADVYRSQVFAPAAVTSAPLSTETGARLRALLYQASQQETMPANRVIDATKFLQSMDSASLNGSMAQLLLDMVGAVQPSTDYNAMSDAMALIDVTGNKPDLALAWLKVAKIASIGMPNVAEGLESYWPLLPLAGLETDKDYARDLSAWLDTILKPGDVKSDTKGNRKMASAILLILEADGFAVPEEAWGKVADSPEFEKQLAPSAFMLDRLRSAGIANLKGQAVLTTLILSDSNGEMPMSTTLEVIRTLRLVGLTSDASSLAREAATAYLNVPYKP